MAWVFRKRYGRKVAIARRQMPTAVPHNISIADLSAAGLRLRPVEAVTIARELTLRAHRGELPGIPTSSVLRFTSDGDTVCEGPVAAGHSVERAGRLLESLLPGFDAPPEFRVPGALRLVVARALGTLDLPAYQTLDEFAEAIARFGAEDMATLVRGLVRTWRAAVEAADTASAPVASAEIVTESLELTISDVRRARRATGLRLADIAQRSRIPISLLRELEWGYFINWPADNYGRSQLVRYARAAGLDVEVVMRAVWPVLEEAVRARTAQPRHRRWRHPGRRGANSNRCPRKSRWRRKRDLREWNRLLLRWTFERSANARPLWLAALAIPALIAIGFAPAVWQSTAGETANPDVAGKVPAASASRTPAAPCHDRRRPHPHNRQRRVQSVNGEAAREPGVTPHPQPVTSETPNVKPGRCRCRVAPRFPTTRLRSRPHSPASGRRCSITPKVATAAPSCAPTPIRPARCSVSPASLMTTRRTSMPVRRLTVSGSRSIRTGRGSARSMSPTPMDGMCGGSPATDGQLFRAGRLTANRSRSCAPNRERDAPKSGHGISGLRISTRETPAG